MASGVITLVQRTLLAAAAFAVLFGMVGMHQLATTAASHPAPAGEHTMIAGDGYQHGLPVPQEPDPNDHHSMLLHLCLAVLAAAGLLVAARVLLIGTAPGAATWASSLWAAARSLPRAPPPPIPRRLAELCVLRR